MASTVTVSDARSALPEILERVNAGEEVTLTRHGLPVAVIVRPDALRSRRAASADAVAQNVRDLLRDGGRSPLPARPGLSPERADAMVSDVRAGRSRR